MTEGYRYNERNELTERIKAGSLTAYHYDKNGSIVSEEEEGRRSEYRYDLLNRQTYVRTLDGKEQENSYDGEGLRAGIVENGRKATFLYHNGEIVTEFDGESAPIRRYLRGVGLSHVQTQDNETYHAYQQDEQGSTAYVTGQGRENENIYQYDAFGNLLEHKENLTNRILYTGQQYDQETGQYYLRARYYNPVVGRFLQEDTYRGDGLNLYAYCANNPVVYYDPSGHTTGKQPLCGSGSNSDLDDTVGSGAVNGNNSRIGADKENTVPTDIYVFGNAEKPQNARFDKDFGLESGSEIISAQTPPLPSGKSVCVDPYNTNLTGTIYKVPEGTELPDGLGIVYDGKDKVPGGHAEGHLTIYPTEDMTVDEFNDLYQSLPWEKDGKKR